MEMTCTRTDAKCTDHQAPGWRVAACYVLAATCMSARMVEMDADMEPFSADAVARVDSAAVWIACSFSVRLAESAVLSAVSI